MVIANPVEYLIGQGFTLEADGNNLIVQPRHLLNNDTRAFIRANKALILALLVADGEPNTVSLPPKPATDGRAVVTYHLQDGKGGVLIDPEGAVSAVQVLRNTYGKRLDWADLLERFEERAAIMEHDGGLQRLDAEHMALRLIRQCMTV